MSEIFGAIWSVLGSVWNDGPLWVVWIAQFFAIEFKALFNKQQGDTLSEVIRFVFGFSKRSQTQGWGMRARRGTFYAFCGWFVGHIIDWW